MAKLVIDLTSVGDELIDVGTYEARVFSVESRVSSAGNPMLVVAFILDHKDYSGRKVFRNFTLTQQAMPFLRRFLVALGFGKDEMAEAVLELDTEDMIGLHCRVRINHREWEGEMMNNVARVLASTDEEANLASLL